MWKGKSASVFTKCLISREIFAEGGAFEFYDGNSELIVPVRVYSLPIDMVLG